MHVALRLKPLKRQKLGCSCWWSSVLKIAFLLQLAKTWLCNYYLVSLSSSIHFVYIKQLSSHCCHSLKCIFTPLDIPDEIWTHWCKCTNLGSVDWIHIYSSSEYLDAGAYQLLLRIHEQAWSIMGLSSISFCLSSLASLVKDE